MPGVLIIPASPEEEPHILPAEEFITWDQMREALKCRTLEVVTIPQLELSLWIDEDGGLIQKPLNRRAALTIFRDSPIRGDVLLASYRTDSEGNPGVLTDTKLRRLIQQLKGKP